MADTNNDNYNRPVSPSILQPHPRKRKNETSDSSEAMIGTAKKKLNVAYIEGVNTGLHDCTCLRNEKALTFRFLINGIPDEKIEIFWDEVFSKSLEITSIRYFSMCVIVSMWCVSSGRPNVSVEFFLVIIKLGVLLFSLCARIISF